MGVDELRRLSRADHGLAVVSTVRPDRSVHSSVVNAGVMDHPTTGRPIVAFVVRGSAHKLRLMRESGRAALVFRSGWEWAGVEGETEIVGPHDVHPDIPGSDLPELLRAVFIAAGGTHDDWDEYDRVMSVEERAAVLIVPQRTTGSG